MTTSKTTTEEIGISEQVLNWINEETNSRYLEQVSTEQVAAKFNLTTNVAYIICSILAQKKLITKLDSVNGNNFDCCGWIINENNEY
jgi:hypothetical protein